MKIEKINDNQIRFTLTREDLESRQIKLSELAYGSEKAKELFRDMMQQAADDYGFEVNNIPLMVEAIPVSADSIILIVTKVDDPDELDSRFARFSGEKDSNAQTGSAPAASAGADDILDLIARMNKIRAQKKNSASTASADTAAKSAGAASTSNASASASRDENADGSRRTKISRRKADSRQTAGGEDDAVFRLTRFFLFRDLETVIRASRVISPDYQGPNVLYKNPEDNSYYLIIRKADTKPEVFNRVCNVLSEYAEQVDYAEGMEQFFREHMNVILRAQAIQSLRTL